MQSAHFNGAALRAARSRRQLTRRELAVAAGVAAADWIRIWEDEAEQPKPEMVPRLAALLMLHPFDLLSGVGDPPCLSALRLAAGMSCADVVAASTTFTKMTYARLDAGRGARCLPPPAGLEELARILRVEPQTVAEGIKQARVLAGTGTINCT